MLVKFFIYGGDFTSALAECCVSHLDLWTMIVSRRRGPLVVIYTPPPNPLFSPPNPLFAVHFETLVTASSPTIENVPVSPQSAEIAPPLPFVASPDVKVVDPLMLCW